MESIIIFHNPHPAHSAILGDNSLTHSQFHSQEVLMLKSGLIVGAVMLVLGTTFGFLFPLCVSCLAIFAGVGAGYLAGVFDKPGDQGSAAKSGASAGAIGGRRGRVNWSNHWRDGRGRHSRPTSGGGDHAPVRGSGRYVCCRHNRFLYRSIPLHLLFRLSVRRAHGRPRRARWLHLVPNDRPEAPDPDAYSLSWFVQALCFFYS